MHATTQLTKPRGDIENNILTNNSSHKYIYIFFRNQQQSFLTIVADWCSMGSVVTQTRGRVF